MVTTIKIKALAYAEGELCDRYFEGTNYGVVGARTMRPLQKIRGSIIEYEYDQNTSVGDLKKDLAVIIWNEDSNYGMHRTEFSFEVDSERYFIDDIEIQLSSIINKYEASGIKVGTMPDP